MNIRFNSPERTKHVTCRLLLMLLSSLIIFAALYAGIQANAAGLTDYALINGQTVSLKASSGQTSGAYKISTESLGGSLTIVSSGKESGTADEYDTVYVSVGLPTGYSLDSITVKGKSKTIYRIEYIRENAYSFVMPGENVTVSASYSFNKSAAFSGDVFWTDTQPLVTDSPMGLVKWSNYSNGSSSSTYTLYLPGGTDLNNLYVYYGNGAPVIDGKTLSQGQAYSFVEGRTYTVNGKSMKVMVSDSSSIYLQTYYDLPEIPYGSMIDKEQTRQTDGQFMSVDANGQIVDQPQVLAQIKGRGNSSWEASCKLFGKYAYNIKLDKKADVLNMGAVKAKSFCLLANNMDESLLRNVETFRSAALAGMGYVPHYETADVYNNGNYLGSYLITEKVDVGGSKLVHGETVEDYHNDPEAAGSINTSYYSYLGNYYQFQYVDTGSVDDGVDISKKSYLLEFDLKERATAENCWFMTPKGQYISLKAPEDLNRDEMLFIINKWVDTEYAVYNGDIDGMSTLMDLSSFADVYLIQEFTKNLDSCASSYYVYYDGTQDSPHWQAAPIWDYDWALGGYDTPYWHKLINSNGDSQGNNKLSNYQGWFAKYKCIIVSDSNQLNTWNFQAQLCNNSTFWNNYVVRAWNAYMYSALSDVFTNSIDQDYTSHKKSFVMNEVRFGFLQKDPISSWGSVDTGDTPYEAYMYLRTWANNRLAWMHSRLSVPFSGLSISADKTMIAKGESVRLTVTPYPSYATDLMYTFSKTDGYEYETICETTDRSITETPDNYGATSYRVSSYSSSGSYFSDSVTVNVLIDVDAYEPSCTKPGNIKYYSDYYSSNLYIRENGVFKIISTDDIEIPATGHSYTTKTVDPTCTEKGYTLHTCSKCGDSYKDTYMDATGHFYKEEVIAPTVTSQGYTVHTCSVCGHSYKDNFTDKIIENLVNDTVVSLTSIKLGGSVKIHGSATGGISPYEFVFYCKKSRDKYYRTLKAFDTTAEFEFIPAETGIFNLRTKVRDQTGKIVTKDLTVTVTSDLANTTTVSASVIGLGSSVKITGSAEGGISEYQYVFYYKKSTATYYKTLKALDTTETAVFKPSETGSYIIRTKVKDQTGKMVTKDLTVTVTSNLANMTTVSAPVINLGGSVKITESAEGGISEYQYVFYYKKSTATYYKTLKALDATETAVFKPSETGTYTIRTKVKDQSGMLVTKDLTVNVMNKLVNATTVSASTTNSGGSVMITGSAAGGTGPYEYAFYYKKSTDKYYKTLKAFDTTAEFDFKPDQPADFNIRTKVRDANGYIAVKDISVKAV